MDTCWRLPSGTDEGQSRRRAVHTGTGEGQSIQGQAMFSPYRDRRRAVNSPYRDRRRAVNSPHRDRRRAVNGPVH